MTCSKMSSVERLLLERYARRAWVTRAYAELEQVRSEDAFVQPALGPVVAQAEQQEVSVAAAQV